VIFLIVIFLSNLYGVEVTQCFFEDRKYDIYFNDCFKIKNIYYSKSVNLPYENYENKKYENIFISSKKAYIEFEEAIKKCGSLNKKSDLKPSYRVMDFKLLKSKSRIANVVINFDEDINVVFGLVKTKNNFYLVYPPKNFEFINKEYRKEVTDFIIRWWMMENKDENI